MNSETKKPVSRVDIAIEGHGFYSIHGFSDEGRQWLTDNVPDSEHGIAYTDDTRLTQNIVDGAFDEGLQITINGKFYVGDGYVAA